MTQVGLDPRTDVTWVVHPPEEAMRLLAEGKVDGYLGFPPDPQLVLFGQVLAGEGRSEIRVLLGNDLDDLLPYLFAQFAIGPTSTQTVNDHLVPVCFQFP